MTIDYELNVPSNIGESIKAGVCLGLWICAHLAAAPLIAVGYVAIRTVDVALTLAARRSDRAWDILRELERLR